MVIPHLLNLSIGNGENGKTSNINVHFNDKFYINVSPRHWTWQRGKYIVLEIAKICPIYKYTIMSSINSAKNIRVYNIPKIIIEFKKTTKRTYLPNWMSLSQMSLYNDNDICDNIVDVNNQSYKIIINNKIFFRYYINVRFIYSFTCIHFPHIKLTLNLSA